MSGERIYHFLFTDIEGSTRLWEQHSQMMSVALAAHNQILEQAVKSHHGRVFKTVGDGFCTVFDSALNAIQAALCAQRALFSLQDQKSIQSVRLKVRMGLHSGPAEARDSDYFGSTLNRVARLMGAASGGQVLISLAMKDHLEDRLPEEIELRNLGKHRLRDLKELETILQVVAPDLPSNFRPINTLSPRVNNLPAQLTSLVGRESDVNEICRLLRLSHVRLVTLLGPGGIGKTRLSLQVGASLLDEYEDGTFFVALAPIIHPEVVIETIAQAIKVEATGDISLLDAVKGYLHDRHVLLILDNFEQVIDAAPLINDLLASAPQLKVLTTSREELMIYGEYVHLVSPLMIPAANQIIDVKALMSFSAIALFVERVQSAKPDFVIDRSNAPYVIEICHRLDGLPLAIELAAVRTRDLSVEEIAGQLSSRLQVLNKGPRDFPSRQRTMRGAIEWSFDLLPLDEQEAFAQLGVFVGPFTVDAADMITGAHNLNRLKEKSLIHMIQENDQTVIFLMLETLREYALEQLNARCELEKLQRQHANYYLQLTEVAEPSLTGAGQIEWFNRLENEQHNIQAALEWMLNGQEFERAGRMVSVLWRFWGAHSLLSVGSFWIEQVLAHSDSLNTYLQAKVKQGAGRLLFLQYAYSEAAEYLKASLCLYEKCKDEQGQAAVQLSLGEIELCLANILSAEKYFQNSLALYSRLEDQAGIARCLGQLGRLAVGEGNLPGAESLFQQALDLLRQYGSTESTAMVMNDLAEVLRTQGKYHEASVLYRESIALYRELDFDAGVAVISHNLGQVARRMGNYQEAMDFFEDALRLLQDLEEKQIIVECIAAIGGLFLCQGEVERAVQYLSATNKFLTEINIQLDIGDQAEYESNLELAKNQLDELTWTDSWTLGQNMSIEQIFTDALRNI